MPQQSHKFLALMQLLTKRLYRDERIYGKYSPRNGPSANRRIFYLSEQFNETGTTSKLHTSVILDGASFSFYTLLLQKSRGFILF